MMNQCNLVEFFSGIGSQAKALKNLKIKVNTLGTSEWDVHAIAAYDLIHNGEVVPESVLAMEKDELLSILKDYTFSNTGKAPLEYRSLKTYSKEVLQRLYASIVRNKNHVDISTLNGDSMPDNIDILTYSFPCQDLSNVGAFHGYNKGIDKDSGSRSSLLWQVGRILTEMKNNGKHLPRYLLMENVPTLLSKRHFGNFSTWIHDLENLGYISKYFSLNANSFGLPQNRPRLLMISVFVGNDVLAKNLVQYYFESKTEETVVSDYRGSEFFKEYHVSDLLRTNYSNEKIFAEAVDCTPNDTVSRQKIWNENPQIVLPGNKFNDAITYVRTITTKQDRNPNSGNLYFDSGIEGRSKFRYLTPRECMLFMGFEDNDYRMLKKNNVEFHKGDALFARDKIIRMAGNSIPVKLLEGIFLQISQIDDMLVMYYRKAEQTHRHISKEAEYVKAIKSYMFLHGIRSRTKKEIYPQDASIVYPKYKVAVYLRPCAFHDCQNARGDILGESSRHLNHLIFSKYKELGCDTNESTNMGWNAAVIWECKLAPVCFEATMNWLENIIRNSVSTESGSVFTCG